MSTSQQDSDLQQSELLVDDQEPPDDTGLSAFSDQQVDSLFTTDALQRAAKHFLDAQHIGDNDLHEAPAVPSTTIEEQSTSLSRPPALPRKASDGTRAQKHRWSQEETQALVDGCNKHGVGNWKKILSDAELRDKFSDRTAGDLKDRFRTYFPDTYHELYPNAKTHLSKAVRGKDAEGKSIFEKGKAKERRPFSADEDAALKKGYAEHGSHWALIAKDPAFQNQRRAIDLRDRFRNAFPDDYERAGFKPRMTKCKKERAAGSGMSSGDAGASLRPTLPFAVDGGALSDGFHAEYSMSDASDGHLTDHGNLTDGNESFLRGRAQRDPSGFLARSNSTGTAFRALKSKLQQSASGPDGEAPQQPLPPRPHYVSSNTMPLPRTTASEISHNRASVGSLFEQLQRASITGTATPSEASSVHGRNTPPSEGDVPLIGHVKAASAEDSRSHAGKAKDAASHKRRSHSTRTGKSSALERLPSVHGHPHAHGHGHPHIHHHGHGHGDIFSPASGARVASELPRPSHLPRDPSSSSEASWPGFDASAGQVSGAQSRTNSAQDDAMDLDDPASISDLWPGGQSTASDVSAASLNTPRSSIYSQIDYPNMQLWSDEVTGHTAQLGIAQQFDATSVTSYAAQSTLSDGAPVQSRPELAAGSTTATAGSEFGARLDSMVQAHASEGGSSSSTGEQIAESPQAASRGVWSSALDAFLDPLQDLLDPLGPPVTSAGNGWANDWSLTSSEQPRSSGDAGGALASTPLSHHKWAGDLHLRTTSTSNLDALLDSFGANPAMHEAGPGSQHSTASSLRSGSTSNHEASPPVSEAGSRPQSLADEDRGRLMSVEMQDSQARLWSPVRRGNVQTSAFFGVGQAATNPCPTPPPSESATQAASRRFSESVSGNVQELLEAASFNLDASLGIDSTAFFPALGEPAFDMRRKKSNETLRNADGIVDSSSVPPFDSDDAASEFLRQHSITLERRNSVPAAAMLGQSNADLMTRQSGTDSASDSQSMLSGLQQMELSGNALDSAYAEAQELLRQFAQYSAPWATAPATPTGTGQGQMRIPEPVEERNPPPPRSDEGLTRVGSEARADAAPGWPKLGSAASTSDSPVAARSASASHVDHRPQILRGLLSNDAAGASITPSALFGAYDLGSAAPDAQMSNAASLWASSGSLDRLEHLYLEGLHSSPSLAAASPLGVAQGAGTSSGGAARSGWLTSSANDAGGTGYLSE